GKHCEQARHIHARFCASWRSKRRISLDYAQYNEWYPKYGKRPSACRERGRQCEPAQHHQQDAGNSLPKRSGKSPHRHRQCRLVVALNSQRPCKDLMAVPQRDVRFTPRKRTSPNAVAMSALCQKRTSKHSSSAVQSLAAECPGQQSLRPPAARMEGCPSPEWLPELVPAIATTADPPPSKPPTPPHDLAPTRSPPPQPSNHPP